MRVGFISQVFDFAVRADRSDRKATSGNAQEIPANRISVSAKTAGGSVKGAVHEDTRARFGTSLRGSPPSSASTIINVAGASARQETLRMPGSTASRALGRLSRSGCSFTTLTNAPSRVQTAVVVGNNPNGTWYE